MQEFLSKGSGKLTILRKQGKQCIIRFEDTGYIRSANYDNVVAGKIKDYYAKSVYGVGFLGEFTKTPYWKQAKQLWKNMIKRCYYENDSRGYYGKVFVSPDWHCFATFLNDLPKIQNFDKWLLGQTSSTEKYNLDKDSLVDGCNVYSKHTCVFLEESENKSLGAKNGKPYTRKKRVATE